MNLRKAVSWMHKHRLLFGVASLLLTAAYGIVLYCMSSELARTLGILYIAIVVTISFVFEIWGNRCE